jgi:hypothetical protein
VRLAFLIGGAALLLAPATAAAAPLGELPFRPLGSEAVCLRATGAPGELVRATKQGLQFLQAGAGGIVPAADLAIGGDPVDCAAVAARPGGAGVAIAPVVAQGDSGEVWVASRDPGGTWTPVAIAAPVDDTEPFAAAAAVSTRGAAIAAWIDVAEADDESGPDSERYQIRVRAVRREPGGSFGAAVQIAAATIEQLRSLPSLQVGIAEDGEAVVLWTDGSAVQAAIAPPGGAFAAPQRLGSVPASPRFNLESTTALGIPGPAQPALAVAADGRALALLASATGPVVAERAPGGGFGPAAALGGAGDGPDQLAAAIDAGGGAILAWRVAEDGAVRTAAPAQPGAFGAATTIGPAVLASARWLLVPPPTLPGLTGGVPLVYGGPGILSARLTQDGRALLAWIGPRAGAGGAWLAAHAATLPLAGGHVELQALGGALRHSGSVAPLLAAGGTPAVAWTDNGGKRIRGRLHLALEGAVTVADPPAPHVRVEPPARRTLRSGDPLALRVTCSAACDVRAGMLGRQGIEGTLSLAKAGAATLRIAPGGRAIAPAHRGPVRVRVLSGAPGARHLRATTLRVTLRRPPPVRRPRVVELAAHRVGATIAVTWRTDIPVRSASFVVVGRRDRGGPPLTETVIGVGQAGGGRRQSFGVSVDAAARVRWVTVSVDGRAGTTVPVR